MCEQCGLEELNVTEREALILIVALSDLRTSMEAGRVTNIGAVKDEELEALLERVIYIPGEEYEDTVIATLEGKDITEEWHP